MLRMSSAKELRAMRLNESPSEKEGKCCACRRRRNCAQCASMKVPPKRKGNLEIMGAVALGLVGLNESPSEKEGKWHTTRQYQPLRKVASMKVPPKRKGNHRAGTLGGVSREASMKVPPKRKGNRPKRP